MASIGAEASSSGATPRIAWATRRSARGLPSAAHMRSDTMTVIRGPIVQALVLPGVSVPSGGW